MTNGEKMQELFPEGETRKCKNGVVFESDGWCHAYDSDWWNAEYKEPTIPNDCEHCSKTYGTLGCCTTVSNEWVYSCKEGHEEYARGIKNDLAVSSELEKNSKKLEKDFGELDCISRADVLQILLDYDYANENALVLKDIKALPPVTPQPCEDSISRQALLNATVNKNSIWNKTTDSKGENLETIISNLPPVTPQEPFMATPCISSKVCEHDRMVTLDKIRAEIEEEIIPKSSDRYDYGTMCQNMGLRMALKVIDKYKADKEQKDGTNK